VAGKSAPSIAAKHREKRLTDDAVRRHAEKHLPAHLARAAESKTAAGATETLEQLDRCLERINLLFDACDRWLRDPHDPSRYEIGPRAEDLWVTYEIPVEEGPAVRKKRRLSELLAEVAGVAPEVRLVETKHADPRQLVLQTAKRLEGAVELLARIRGEIKDTTVLNLTMTAEWVEIRTVILQALEPHPAARLAVAGALESYAGG
jgi:hypothetical protein